MTIAIGVVYATTQNASTSNITSAGFQTPANNALIVVGITLASGFAVNTVTDTIGTSYSTPIVIGPSGGGHNIYVSYGVTTTSASSRPTGNLSGTTGACIVAATFTGFAGGAFLDGSVEAPGTLGVCNSGPFTSRNASELLIGVAEMGGSNALTWTNDPGFSTFAGNNTGAANITRVIIMQYKILTSTGTNTYNPTSTNTVSTTVTGIVGISDSALPQVSFNINTDRIWVLP